MSTNPTTLGITFTNNSNVEASQVHVGFISTSPIKITNPADGSPILRVDDLGGKYPGGNWYTLEQLSEGVSVTSFSGGRVYICYGTPWQVERSGYEPGQTPADKNFFLRYDKLEMTFTGQQYDVADLTSIDYWSIPMTLNARKGGEVVGTVNGLAPGVTAQRLFEALNALTSPTPPSGLEGALPALVPGQFSPSPGQLQQDPGGSTSGAPFARVIGPSSYPPVYPPPGGRPLTPYDLLSDYLTHLFETYGPGTTGGGASPPTPGNGVIAFISGRFAGVGGASSGPLSPQDYDLTATIDADLNITLKGTTQSGAVDTVMVFKKDDLLNPSGIYGGNAPFYLNGSSDQTSQGNDVYGWISGDLFAGLNVGAVGSAAEVKGQVVGAMPSQDWFKLPVSSFFANLQPGGPYYNQWAAALSPLSQAYNFAYTDRFAHVLLSLNPANVDTLEIVLEDATVDPG